MKIQVDLENKEITINKKVSLQEVIDFVKKIGNSEEWSLNCVTYPIFPTNSPVNPYRPLDITCEPHTIPYVNKFWYNINYTNK